MDEVGAGEGHGLVRHAANDVGRELRDGREGDLSDVIGDVVLTVDRGRVHDANGGGLADGVEQGRVEGRRELRAGLEGLALQQKRLFPI